MFILVRQAELLGDNEVYNRVSAYLDHLEGGFQFRLLLHFLVCVNHNKILDLVHVSFIHILITQFLTDILVNTLLFGR